MNSAQKLMKRIQQMHFNDQHFARIPQMTDDERKEYMLYKLDQMVYVQYETPSPEEEIKFFLRLKELTGGDMSKLENMKLEQMPADIQEHINNQTAKSPDVLWASIWYDPSVEEWVDGCPFFDFKLLNELTDAERKQVNFLCDYTQVLGCISIGQYFPLELLLPAPKVNACDMPSATQQPVSNHATWNATDDFCFREGATLETFIRTTRHWPTAAALCHVVLAVTEREVRDVAKKADAELRAWCDECADFLHEADLMPWMQAASQMMPPRQYIARAHALMHTAELDYHLNEILKHAVRV